MAERKTKVLFMFERSTAGAHRFQEVDAKGNILKIGEGGTGKIGTLYFRKSFMGEDAPKRVEVTVEW